MTDVTVTDEPINYRPESWGTASTWGLTVNGLKVGTVWETEDGYTGYIEGRTAAGETRSYICPEVKMRDTVIERLAEMTERIGIVEVPA